MEMGMYILLKRVLLLFIFIVILVGFIFILRFFKELYNITLLLIFSPLDNFMIYSKVKRHSLILRLC